MNQPPTDCGCGGTKGGSVRSTSATPAGSREAETTTTPPAHNAARAGGTVVTDGFRGLNPVDGLFLRADHLDAIQTYARSLTVALASATGPGVVHGLGVTLDQKLGTIEVSPGLAVTPHGQPLLLNSSVQLPLDDNLPPRPSPDGFWRIELHPARVTSGSAPVFGGLCNDGCAGGGGATIQPWRDEGVEIRFEPHVTPGLDSVRAPQRRNWLASQYFERERTTGGPWLTPTAEGETIGHLRERDWDNATPLPAEAGVPLALVQQIEDSGCYILDMWAARRLVDGPPASATWRNRFAMRPWSVFLAQVLQFQDELAGRHAECETHVRELGSAYLSKPVAECLEVVRSIVMDARKDDPIQHQGRFKKLKGAFEQLPPNSIPSLGVAPTEAASSSAAAAEEIADTHPSGELPPAGYLPSAEYLPDDQLLHALRRDFFANLVHLRLRRVRADQIADEVLAAQHRDRIPLIDQDTNTKPLVDVLVPSEPADKAELRAKAYRWVAFVRAPRSVAPEIPALATAKVAVHLYTVDKNDWLDNTPESRKKRAKEIGDEDKWREGEIATLTYLQGTADYPGNDTMNGILQKVETLQRLAIITLSPTQERCLAALRASLMSASLDSGDQLPVFAFEREEVNVIIIVAAEQPA